MKQHRKISVSKKVFFLAFATLIIAVLCVGCSSETAKSTGQIFLYGEAHGVPRIMDRQLEIWYDYYHNHNMRHLFIEFAYFTAEFLNIWMKSDNDDILYELFDDWVGTVAHHPHKLVFYKTIKREFPETIFHGIDIGHQYWSTGQRFLQYLRGSNKQGTVRYLLTLEAIEQGEFFYKTREFGQVDWEYRVIKMTENFIREFDQLDGQNVMGIFGARHTRFGFMEALGLYDVPTMAERLRERYGDSLHTTDLFLLRLQLYPIRVDIININNVDYEASYFGTDLTSFSTVIGDVVSRSFWRLENAYDDFRNKPTNEYWLPFDNYPMVIELNQVFIVDIVFTNDSILRHFYRSIEGAYWQGRPITTGFNVD
ncbi:MAG: hypothetical protein FWC97_03870 [Treponema sp.]|nr:hypothetical protein [Treponema sp.]